MAKKHTYRSVSVQQVDAVELGQQLSDSTVIVALDVAKEGMVVAFAKACGETQRIVRFRHPVQTRDFLALLHSLREQGKTLQIVMEPTGTYGDVIRDQCLGQGLQVSFVHPKRTHDAKEIFDGVPSQHDAKDCTIIARLQAQGLSKPYVPKSPLQRELRAMVSLREIYDEPLQRLHDRLEPLLACYWPELGQSFHVRERKTPLYLLQQFPDPAMVRGDPEGARALILRKHPRIEPERLEQCLHGAHQSLGITMSRAEQQLIIALVSEILRLTAQVERVDAQIAKRLESQTEPQASIATLRRWLGATTLAVLWGYLGALEQYGSAGALEKACGLNLRESSSGNDAHRGIHLTKRGPGVVRKYLYLATLRWIQRDPYARAWYVRRAGFSDKSKLRAVVALMRKMVHALYAMRNGQAYDAQKLFDTTRLPALVPAAVESCTEASASAERRNEEIQAVRA